jgi:hypothetical protein
VSKEITTPADNRKKVSKLNRYRKDTFLPSFIYIFSPDAGVEVHQLEVIDYFKNGYRLFFV